MRQRGGFSGRFDFSEGLSHAGKTELVELDG
jgi:hypothetical protein